MNDVAFVHVPPTSFGIVFFGNSEYVSNLTFEIQTL